MIDFPFWIDHLPIVPRLSRRLDRSPSRDATMRRNTLYVTPRCATSMISRHRPTTFAISACLAAFLLGAYLRFDQFFEQVLIDDEWHAVHQLIESTPARIVTSFGHADYSIPLTLLYWFEAKYFGLSEVAMRWPMMLCGLTTLAVFPAFIWRQLGRREAALFAFLLSLSPILIIYSRTARPYAITLLISYLALYAFEAYRNRSMRAWGYGGLYGACAVLATWLHPIVAPLVAAPCVLELFSALGAPNGERKARLQRLLGVGVPTALVMLGLVLPPLLVDPEAITGKAGMDLPTLDTLAGAGSIWFGTGSWAALSIAVFLSILGWKRLWRELPISRSVIAGMAMTTGLIFLSRPAWIHHPLTFGRYLLPLLPLLLLSVALGSIRLVDKLRASGKQRWRRLAPALLVFPPLLLAVQSPVFAMLHDPNSYTLHTLYQFDFRPGHNAIRKHLDTFTQSDYWQRLRTRPANSMRIAVAPWFFESYDWPAPRWERSGKQRVIPGFLTGFCLPQRRGEPLQDDRFKFQNGVFLNEVKHVKRIDVLIFQKPYIPHPSVATNYTSEKIPAICASKLIAELGGPDYEDDTIFVFLLSPAARAAFHAQRE